MKIRNLLYSLLTLGLLLSFGCKKEETPGTPAPSGSNDPLAEVGAIPASFTKKTVIEKFTGEWCVNCPDGAAKLKAVLDAHPGVTYAAEIHQGDWLELSQLNTLKTHLGGIAGYPRAAIDRVPAQGTSGQDGLIVYSRTWWEINTARLLQNQAKAGLALVTKLNGTKLNIKVFAAGKEAITSDTRLTVYILEDNILAKNQVGGSAGYTHHHVLRKVVSAGTGDAIDLKQAGKHIIKEYNDVDISGFTSANLKVLAFINVVGASSSTHEVLNGQEVKAGQTKKWN